MAEISPTLDRVGHESAAGSWDACFRAPHPALREAVRGCYQGFVERGTRFPARRELPHGDLVLILNLGSPFRVRGPKSGGAQGAKHGSFVAGLHDVHVLTESPGDLACIDLKLTPIGAHRLLGVGPGTLTNRVVDLDQLYGHDAERLLDALASTPDWHRRFNLLDRFLLDRWDVGRTVAAPVAWAWQQLVDRAGQVPIGDLVQALGWSRKHLTTRFRHDVGMAPKVFARVLRFQRAVDRLNGPGDRSWAELALDCGYYDQAHFNRDFRAFAGLTPRRYRAGRLPDGGGLADA